MGFESQGQVWRPWVIKPLMEREVAWMHPGGEGKRVDNLGWADPEPGMGLRIGRVI